jgi:DNA-binding GntR family transcriptional regulator
MLRSGVASAEVRVTASANIAPPDGAADQTVDRLHHALREQILNGRLSPGSPVSQVKLARAFEVGRTPLREALRMLQREGLVQAEFNRRIRVSPLSTSELEQIYAHRIVLEAVAIRGSIPRFSADDLARLRTLVTEMESFMPNPAERLDEWERPHREFHQLLVAHAGDRILEDLHRLQDHAERYRAILGRDLPAGDVPATFGRGAREHAELVVACETGQKEQAGRILAGHLARSGLTLIAHTDPAHDSVALREALLIVQAPAR